MPATPARVWQAIQDAKASKHPKASEAAVAGGLVNVDRQQSGWPGQLHVLERH